MNKHAKRSFWAALGRFFGVFLGAGAGSLLYGFVGSNTIKVSVAMFLACLAFCLIWFAEYEREKS